MQKIGHGILNWSRIERQSNRYGTFYLADRPFSMQEEIPALVEPELDTPAVIRLTGTRVRLVCEIVETRDSEHIGDISLGIKPSTPDVGEWIEMGVGTLALIGQDPSLPFSLALVPIDFREELWMDPRILYRLHSQTVNLYAEQITDEPAPPPELPRLDPDVVRDGVAMYIVSVGPQN